MRVARSFLPPHPSCHERASHQQQTDGGDGQRPCDKEWIDHERNADDEDKRFVAAFAVAIIDETDQAEDQAQEQGPRVQIEQGGNLQVCEDGLGQR